MLLQGNKIVLFNEGNFSIKEDYGLAGVAQRLLHGPKNQKSLVRFLVRAYAPVGGLAQSPVKDEQEAAYG